MSMRKYRYMIGWPNLFGENTYAEVELDLSKEETLPFIGGIQWHDKRDARWPAWRLIQEIEV